MLGSSHRKCPLQGQERSVPSCGLGRLRPRCSLKGPVATAYRAACAGQQASTGRSLYSHYTLCTDTAGTPLLDWGGEGGRLGQQEASAAWQRYPCPRPRLGGGTPSPDWQVSWVSL